MRAAFCLFLLVKWLCVPTLAAQAYPEQPTLFHLTKEQRGILCHMGVVDARLESVVLLAKQRHAHLLEELEGSGALLAVDNYNKLRYTTNTAVNKNTTINTASLVVLRLTDPLFLSPSSGTQQ